jgi:hypothetical protein
MVDEIARHVKLAKRVLDQWERQGLPGPTAMDDRQKIDAEVELLEEMASRDPRRAKSLHRLAAKYRELQRKVAA